MVNKNSPGLFRHPKPRDRLTSLVSWKRRYHKESLTLSLWLAPIRSLPCVCILRQCNSTPLLQAKRAYSDGPVPPLLLTIISNLSKIRRILPPGFRFGNKEKVNLGNKFSSRSWDRYSFIFTYRPRGEKVRFLAKVNWLPVLKSTALTEHQPIWATQHPPLFPPDVSKLNFWSVNNSFGSGGCRWKSRL